MVGWCSNHRPRTHTKKVPRANFKLTKSKHPENGKTAKGMFKKGVEEGETPYPRTYFLFRYNNNKLPQPIRKRCRTQGPLPDIGSIIPHKDKVN